VVYAKRGAFSIVPIRASAVVGGLALFFSLLYVLYSFYAKLVLRIAPQGFTALIVAIIFFQGFCSSFWA